MAAHSTRMRDALAGHEHGAIVERERRAVGTGLHREEFVAQSQQARRLETDDGHAAFDKRFQRDEHAVRFRFRLVDQSGGEKRAPATQRARAVGCLRQMY